MSNIRIVPYQQTLNNYTVPSGTHDVVYENCIFTGNSTDVDRRGVLTLNNSCYNIVFSNCTIKSGLGNGVKIVDAGGNVHDIRFENCTFESQPRMGFECISRPPDGVTEGYYNVDLIDCTFETQGSEAVSYDGYYASNCLIDGVLIKGSGTNMGTYPWGEGLEINACSSFTVRNTTIYRTGADTLNLDTVGSTFTDCTFDMSVNYIGSVSKGTYDAIVKGYIADCVFDNCTMAASNQGTVGLLNSPSSDNDFTTCTFSGDDNFHKRVAQYTGCSGNTFPVGAVLTWQ